MAKKRNRQKLGAQNAAQQNAAPQLAASPGKLAIQAQYDAARQGRRLASWNPPSSGPNRAIAGLQTIRNRSRDASRNEWAGASGVRTLVTDLIGTGITARPKTKKAALKAALQELWTGWMKSSDADGVLDFYGQQALAARTWEEAGEVFARFRPRRMDDGLTVPLQIQLIEPEMIPLLDRDLPNGNRIRQGIELNRIGKRVNYWMYKEHPGDFCTSINAQDLVPIPAEQVIHLYDVKRPGQMRGAPDNTSTLVPMKTVGDYNDAVTEKAKLQNLFTGVIKRQAPMPGQENIDPLTGEVITYSNDGVPMVSLEPGGMIELSPGEDIVFSNPPATGVGYNDFMRQQYLGISSGRGVPYELATGDIVNISDRSLRVIIQQYRRNIEQKQWLNIIPMFCQKIRDAWVDAAVLAGAIDRRDAAEAKNVEWSPQAWPYIHPVQDVQAKVSEIEAGIVSRDQVISSRGYDPEEVDASRADGKQREEKLGLTIAPVAPPDPAQVAADKKTADQQTAQKVKAEIDLLAAQSAAAATVAAAEHERAQAYTALQADEAIKARAASDLLAARACQAAAESALASARMDQVKAELAVLEANAEHQRCIASQESEARIAESAARADTSLMEATERTNSLKAAEAHAQQQRELVLQAEHARVEAARLEVAAAQLGLQELQGI